MKNTERVYDMEVAGGHGIDDDSLLVFPPWFLLSRASLISVIRNAACRALIFTFHVARHPFPRAEE